VSEVTGAIFCFPGCKNSCHTLYNTDTSLAALETIFALTDNPHCSISGHLCNMFCINLQFKLRRADLLFHEMHDVMHASPLSTPLTLSTAINHAPPPRWLCAWLIQPCVPSRRFIVPGNFTLWKCLRRTHLLLRHSDSAVNLQLITSTVAACRWSIGICDVVVSNWESNENRSNHGQTLTVNL
jgi:hypothetical protein